MTLTGSTAVTRRELAELLGEARARTVLLVSPLSSEDMLRRPAPVARSVLQQLDAILGFEEQELLALEPGSASDSYDAWFDRMMEVRGRVLEQLDAGLDPSHPPDVYLLAIEHEYQRTESILQIIQCLERPYDTPHQRALPLGRTLADPGTMVRFPGGPVEIGLDPDQPGWPGERPAHVVELEPFWIDVMPVTNEEYLLFMSGGGYQRRELWSQAGWEWLLQSRVTAPAHWYEANGAWRARRLGHDLPLEPDAPVCHVSFYEAEACAGFLGKRLPSESEWETAAAWDPGSRRRRSYPWGNMPPSPHVANLDQLAFGPATTGAFPGNLSPIGCYGMIGDVWEWTSSPYVPYPGGSARAAGEVRVLRGGSWASRSRAVRVTGRRPALPGSRHLFAGFRCASS